MSFPINKWKLKNGIKLNRYSGTTSRSVYIEQFKTEDGSPLFKLTIVDYGTRMSESLQALKNFVRKEFAIKSTPRFKWEKLKPSCTYEGCVDRFRNKLPCALCYE